MAWCDVVEPRTLRACRIALGQSQAAFAAMLGASPESYRTWDAGRRAPPPTVLARARALATHRDDHALLPLPVLVVLQLSKSGKSAIGRVERAPSHAATSNSLLMNCICRRTSEPLTLLACPYRIMCMASYPRIVRRAAWNSRKPCFAVTRRLIAR